MIIDHLLKFTSNAGQTLTAAAASDYRIDFGQEAPTTGMDTDKLYAIFTVKTAVTGKLQIKLQDCDTESGSYADCAVSAEYDAPAAGTQIVIPVPRHHKRFLQAYFGGPSTGGPSAGVIHGFISAGLQDNVAPAQAEAIQSLWDGSSS